MKIHAMMSRSTANGPGVRSVIWFQGCQGMTCAKDCWNPETHPTNLGVEIPIRDILAGLLDARWVHGAEGVTFSGGEPFQQISELWKLVMCIKVAMPDFSIGVFTGYSVGELEAMPLFGDISQFLDFAVTGRYNSKLPAESPLVTSRNQELRLYSNRYSQSDFAPQSVEVTIDDAGLHQLTGFPTKGLL